MMRTLVTAAVLAAGLIPAAAPVAAQSSRELRRDRQDIREQRQDLRDARQEYREDYRDRYGRGPGYRDGNWGRNDWRGYRSGHRDLYARGGWNAPFRYQRFGAGARIAPSFYGRGYWIADPGRYRLPRTVGAQRWVRHYDDVLLVDTRRGVVVDAIRGFYF